MNFLMLFAIILPVLSGAGLLLSKIEDRAEVHKFSFIVLGLTLVVTIVSNIVNFGKNCTMLTLPMGLSVTFSVDWVAAFFSTIFTVIWFLVGIYSEEYLKHEGKDKRFVGFYIVTLFIYILFVKI